MRAVALIVAVLFSSVVFAVEPDVKTPRKSPPGVFELRLVDQSTVKGSLSDGAVDVVTKYGKLSIPVADIQRIDFGVRLSPEQQKRLDAAMARMASNSEKTQAEGIAELIKLRESAIPALTKAASAGNGDLVVRAKDALQQVVDAVGLEAANARYEDAVHTAGFTIVGRIESTSIRLATSHFGELNLKIADVRALRLPGAAEPETAPTNVLPDPGNLIGYEAHIGKTFYFRVVGAPNGSLWGTEEYTTDSTLAAAAVHMGIVKIGQPGVVKVQMKPSPPAFTGTSRNGLTSSNYGQYRAAYKLSKP